MAKLPTYTWTFHFIASIHLVPNLRKYYDQLFMIMHNIRTVLAPQLTVLLSHSSYGFFAAKVTVSHINTPKLHTSLLGVNLP